MAYHYSSLPSTEEIVQVFLVIIKYLHILSQILFTFKLKISTFQKKWFVTLFNGDLINLKEMIQELNWTLLIKGISYL